MRPPVNKFAQWFRAIWPGTRWPMVIEQYHKIGKAALADIAARGGIYSTHFIASEREAAFQEGRRSLALEIIELAEMDPNKLRSLIEAPLERKPQ